MKHRVCVYGVLSVLIIILLVCGVIMYHMSTSQQTRVIFLDVGQGDATLISRGNEQILIDGGPDGTVLLEELGRHMPFWDRTIEIVIATHPDADHIDGLISVFDHYHVQQLWQSSAHKDSTAYDALVRSFEKEHGLRVINAIYGLRAFMGGGVLQVIFPYTRQVSDSDVNAASIVALYEIGNEVFYFGGDAPMEVEDSLFLEKDISILKASHHGSNTSTSENFIRKTQPRDVIISVGAENRYGHPHGDVLTRILRSGAHVLRTDQMSSIVYVCDHDGCLR